MKKQFLLTLPLAACLAVPAFAQQAQSSSSSSSSNQAQTQSSSQDQQNSTQTGQASSDQAQSSDQNRAPLTYESRQGFWGKLNPFARKKYVQKQLDPVRGRVNELDELTAANAKMIKDVDARASEGIRMASNRANEADQHAIDAGNRAQQANQTATQANQRVDSVQNVVTNIDQYKPVTDAEIRFRPGQLVLSKKAKTALDEMAEPLKNQKGYIVEVQGFSSGRGQAAIENSQRMAESVVRYLVLNHDIPVYRIYTMGMGNAPVQASQGNGKARRTSGGRVEVAILKNGAGDLETSAMAGQANYNDNGTAVNGSSAPASNNAAPPSTSVGASPNSNAEQQQPASSAPASNQNAQPSAQQPNQTPR